ncbi:hypothetical protein BH24BAC1_BH24BAC1_34280 [soil metagenome]
MVGKNHCKIEGEFHSPVLADETVISFIFISRASLFSSR